MTIHYNPEIGSKGINVHVPGVSPICRIDVDGHRHGDAGRRHKHSLQTERCPDRNLPDGVIQRDDLAGCSVQEVFDAFCQAAQIRHDGTFDAPDVPQGGTS
ncbi:MAG: hypothetical protein A2289_27085 [Deltaproteobacteria bacterium RIFOXYA12_FULL_58_15]|nr:MAG: hypothetical protein A2289_27085 [Deltaproteobacteria bacterium RIFOXYA12_FULL_58_15]